MRLYKISEDFQRPFYKTKVSKPKVGQKSECRLVVRLWDSPLQRTGFAFSFFSLPDKLQKNVHKESARKQYGAFMCTLFRQTVKGTKGTMSRGHCRLGRCHYLLLAHLPLILESYEPSFSIVRVLINAYYFP